MAEDKSRKRKPAIKPGSVKAGALAKRKEVGEKGWLTGYKVLDEFVSYKKGYSTTIYSYAHQGKTQFTLDQCVNLAVMYGAKIAVYLTEAGDPEEIVLEIAQTYMRRSLADKTLTDEEIEFAIDTFVDKHFYILNAQSQLFSITELAWAVHDTNEEYGIELDVVVIDHFGNLEKGSEQKYFKTDENVKHVMQTVNRMSKKLNIHTFILFHIRDTEPVKCPKSNIYYLPKPEHHNISGGQQANYQGMQMIAVWRPVYHPNKYGIVDPETGEPYELNETRIIVSKSKPKHIGKLGEGSLFFDVHKQSYYESGYYFAREGYETDSALFNKEKKYTPFDELYKTHFQEEKLRKTREFFEKEVDGTVDGVPAKKTAQDLGF